MIITEGDFLAALKELTPSVSQEEMRHYEEVQRRFAGETLNSEVGRAKGTGKGKGKMQVNGIGNGGTKGKGKGKAIDHNQEQDDLPIENGHTDPLD